MALLYNLGKVSWPESQLIYHALAYLGREALSLVSPAGPYVCIGRHQDVEQEVDLDFCRTNQIPVFRREVGGGAVYLDGHQYFYQLILRRDHPLVTPDKEAFYRRFLDPVIKVYRRIGIPARYKPVNDVIARDRKISGTGVAEIGDCLVFVGNLIYDFDYETMSRVLKIPDEKFRDKVHKTMKENLSTIRRELGGAEALPWTEDRLNGLLVEEFEKILGPLQPGERDARLQAKVAELEKKMINENWLRRKGRQAPGRQVRIRSGVEVFHRMSKAPGGLIRADFEMINDKYAHVSLSGDWFCYPEEAVATLEENLAGKSRAELRSVLTDFYGQGRVETPGLGLEDWLKVLAV